MTIPEIWIRIIHLLRISLSEDISSDIREKRSTLRNLALTHPWLTDIALDELWRSMETLQPVGFLVIDRFNEFPSGFLKCRPENWYITFKPHKEHIMSRISKYLARIRTFRFEVLNEEFGVCSSLSMLDPIGWLFPNLQELYINFSEMAILQPHYLAPLLAPSLRSLTLYTSSNSIDEEAACDILRRLRSRKAKIREISYIGYSSSLIVEAIMSFSSLRALSIPCCAFSKEGECRTITTSFLTRNLTNLDINVDHFPENVLQQLRKGLESLVSLTSLSLRGSLDTIHKFIRDLKPVASISSFGLYRHSLSSSSKDRIAALIPSLATIFPHLHTLHLENMNRNILMVTLNDLMSLQEKPMQTLILINCLKSTDPTNDIREILKVWPKLHHLWFDGDDVFAEEILPLISGSAPFLRDLTLPLRFNDEWNGPIVTQVVCPLQYLRIPPSYELFPKVFGHARILLELFPELKTISERTGSIGRYATVDLDAHDLSIDNTNSTISEKRKEKRRKLNVPIRSMGRECNGTRVAQALGLM